MIRKIKGAAYKPEVVYPSIDEKSFNKTPGFSVTIDQLLEKKIDKERTVILTSLNRYERKKNIPLALESFAYYIKNGLKEGSQKVEPLLVIAGGFDPRLEENVQVHQELQARANELGIQDKIVFLKSISNDQRILLLENTKVLLYTPENEHFGIVPVEAMYMGCIALACNSGGPLESVEDGQTGYLMPPNSEIWGKKITDILNGSRDQMVKMQKNAKARVIARFTFAVFASQLDQVLKRMSQ